MRRLGRALFAPLLLVTLLSDVAASAYGASSPPLGAATTYGILASTYINPVLGTTITGDVGFTTAPATVPLGVHTNYSSSYRYLARTPSDLYARRLLLNILQHHRDWRLRNYP